MYAETGVESETPLFKELPFLALQGHLLSIEESYPEKESRDTWVGT